MAAQECLMLWGQDFSEQSHAPQPTACEELFLNKNMNNDLCVFRNKH